jgi:hypothetical protein
MQFQKQISIFKQFLTIFKKVVDQIQSLSRKSAFSSFKICRFKESKEIKGAIRSDRVNYCPVIASGLNFQLEISRIFFLVSNIQLIIIKTILFVVRMKKYQLINTSRYVIHVLRRTESGLLTTMINKKIRLDV